jgi:hypothetical protein
MFNVISIAVIITAITILLWYVVNYSRKMFYGTAPAHFADGGNGEEEEKVL